MQQILLFGAGKSATALIHYLLKHSTADGSRLVVVDADAALAQKKIDGHSNGIAVSFDINNAAERRAQIAASTLVISLLPPALHDTVAEDCLALNKHLLTASYVDDRMRALSEAAAQKGLLFLCEMGLDPGIDHMSAAQMIANIRSRGGKITSFLSHCGGLVAPESDDNPWHYKISWNPRNVVLAGKAGAHFRQDGKEEHWPYEKLFAEQRFVNIPGWEPLCWYPNRDSLSYAPLFGLEGCPTFIRTTLRHPDFMWGWKNVIDLKLTDEVTIYDTADKTLHQFFGEHMTAHGFDTWLQQKMLEGINQSKDILQSLLQLVEMEQQLNEKQKTEVENFMTVGPKGTLQQRGLEEVKTAAAATVAQNMHNSKLTLSQLFFLGMDDEHTRIKGDRNTAADVLQQALEAKLVLHPTDKDRVVMLHEIGYEQDGKNFVDRGSLIVDGTDGAHTAMAKTVGLPLGIAARGILQNTLKGTGVTVPVTKDIYDWVLPQLATEGIAFTHSTTAVD